MNSNEFDDNNLQERNLRTLNTLVEHIVRELKTSRTIIANKILRRAGATQGFDRL